MIIRGCSGIMFQSSLLFLFKGGEKKHMKENFKLSKEAIDFLEGKWILDGMDAHCNAIQFFNSNKKDERSALDYASCLRVIVYRSVLCVTDINQLLSLYTYERPFT